MFAGIEYAFYVTIAIGIAAAVILYMIIKMIYSTLKSKSNKIATTVSILLLLFALAVFSGWFWGLF